MLHVALYQPEIPPNTGNIGRLCVGFQLPLLLIDPLGFSLDERARRRAGLDYWERLHYKRFANLAALVECCQAHARPTERSVQLQRMVCLSKHGLTSIYDWSFRQGDVLLLGNETRGVPQQLTEQYGIERITLPMSQQIRSYNLANAAAMVLVEAYRQLRWDLG